MNLPPLPKTPMLLSSPNMSRFVFWRDHRNGMRQFFRFENGWSFAYFKPVRPSRAENLTPEEAEKLARNIWKEIFGDGEQMV